MLSCISSALFLAPSIPLSSGVRIMVAPYALSSLCRSMLMFSGIVRMSLYPLHAAVMASPTPVFPLVGSIIVPPGFNPPLFSASSTIERAIRSLALPPGLNDSIFATMRALRLYFLFMLHSSTSGVLPIS